MVPITRRFLEGTDLCDETDLRRFDQISFGSSGARVDVAVEGRDIPGMEVAVKELVVCLSPIAIIINTFLNNKLQMFNPCLLGHLFLKHGQSRLKFYVIQKGYRMM
jgi:hypothetical protein